MCGVRVCAECRRGGRYAALCDTHASVRLLHGWAEVAQAADEARAEMLAGTVRAAGLDAQLLSQKDHATVVSFTGLAIVRVLVPAFQWERARAALEGSAGDRARA